MKYFSLPDAVILEVKGPHAAKYLQARLTNDLRSLTQDQGMLAAALTPQGKTEGLFTILKQAEDAYLLYADGGDRNAVIQGLKRFLVAERVEVSDMSPRMTVLHYCDSSAPLNSPLAAFPASNENDLPLLVRRVGEFILIRKVRGELPGWDILASSNSMAKVTAEFSAHGGLELALPEQTLLRLRAGVPKFPEEINADLLFVSAGLGSAISYTKGCYTGQEVVAKIDALGKSPRILKLLEADLSSPAAGQEVISSSDGKAIGKVLSCIFDSRSGKSLCFADLRNIDGLAEMALSIGGASARLGSV